MSTDTMEQLLSHEAYEKGIQRLRSKGLNIRPVSDFDLSRASAMGECSLSEPRSLSHTLEQNLEGLLRYTCIKLRDLEGADDQDYNPAEEGLNTYESVTLSGGEYSYSCLCTHLVEYHLLKEAPQELEGYLKRYRIPGAKKYAAQLRRFYKRSV